MWGVDEGTCYKCRQGYYERNKQAPCANGKCAYTGRPKVRLSFTETQILDDLLDYIQTGEIVSRDRERRDILLTLKGVVVELHRKKEEWQHKKNFASK